MANSLQDQLLNSGIATEEQLQKAQESKKRPKKQHRPKKQQTAAQKKPRKQKKPVSDLAQFYKERSTFERKTREEEERKRKEAARLKKLNAKKIRKILLDNQQNAEDAEIRYNFVVGNNIKYLYVTEAQQKLLAEGKLAITFLGGRRCLIPASIIASIREIDPNKLIVVADPEEGDDLVS